MTGKVREFCYKRPVGTLVYVPAFASNHCAYPQKGWPGWVDVCGWLYTEIVYPSAGPASTNFHFVDATKDVTD